MKTLYTACLLCVFLFVVSCDFGGRRINGNGNVTTQNRNVSNASKIDLVGSVDVVLATGETSVKVEADENILQYILTEESDGWLKIRTRDDVNINTDNNITVYVTTPAITHLKVTGSGDMTSDSKFTSNENIRFDVTGSGNMTIPVHTPGINASITGSGNLEISGETKDTKVSIAGSGNFNGKTLKSENADISIAGSGDAYIYADVRLKASIMGSGGVKYKGNATVEKSVMGSGDVSKAD